MEFTPSTGLRLRAPLQWEPIQLISQNGTTGFGLITETGHQQQSLQDLLSESYKTGLQQSKEAKYN